MHFDLAFTASQRLLDPWRRIASLQLTCDNLRTENGIRSMAFDEKVMLILGP